MKIIIWWILYTVLGIWLQRFIPGLDCYAPALAGCLYLGLPKTAFVMSLIWIIIQEGVGSLALGSSLLFYGGVAIFFVWAKIFFTKNSLLFFLVVSLFTAGLHFVIMQTMCSLQELHLPMQLAVQDSLLTLIFFPILWMITVLSYSHWIIDFNV